MKIQAIAAVVAPIFAIGAPFVLPKIAHVRSSLLDTTPASLSVQNTESAKVSTSAASSQAEKATLEPSVATHVEFADLHTSIEQGVVSAEMRGNGRDWVRAKLRNNSDTPLKIQVDVGQMLEAGQNIVVVVHPTFCELSPGRTTEVVLETAATRSGNKTNEQSYRLTYGRLPKIETFLSFAQNRTDLSISAIQTAVLALAENLPLSAVCKFPTVAGEIKSRFNTDAFRAETGDIVAALTALREAGVPDGSVVMTIDPQLKIESMIDPMCKAVAMRYYGVNTETEWAYWRDELLKGDQSTRHYALYGIARFYPDTALEMLPKWAREARTSTVFRLAAVQALAETQRPEALPLLRQLASELGEKSELGRAAVGAAEYLESRFAEAAMRQPGVAFRTGPKLTQF